jgi:hypothetical protein
VGAAVLDPLVAPVEAHHCFMVKMGGDVLDGLEFEAGDFDLID